MDRNTFTGLFLILLILAGSVFFMRPSEEDLKKEKLVQDSIAKANSGKPAETKKPDTAFASQNKPVDSALLKGAFGSARVGQNAVAVLENEFLKVNINAKGGRIESVELKNYKTFDNKPLILFKGDENKFGLVFNAGGQNINTNDLYFTASTPSVKVAKSDSSSLTMRLSYADGQNIDYVYSLKGESYKVGFDIVTSGLGNVINASQKHLTLNWEATLHQKEKDIASEHRYSTTYYKTAAEDVDHLSYTKDEEKQLNEGKVQWVSFKQHFFSNVLIAEKGFDNAKVEVKTRTEPGIVKSFAANMQFAYAGGDQTYKMDFYFGPNQFKTLKDQGYDLEKQVDMGYWPLKYINRFAVLPIFNLLEKLNWSYGLIILALTIILKLVLFPLTYKSYLSMAKMRVLKPEMEEIKAKVGEDNPTLVQQEYLKLYKKAGVNPLGGCLPMVMQLPIIMAFFFFFPNLFELRGESFLWMKDLSTYDAFFNLGFSLPFLGNHISLMCILMTISTLIYTYFNNQVSGATGQMKYIGYITPIIFFGVLNSYPAGLNYYYFCANMITFAQQYFIRQMVDDNKIHAQIQENKKKPQTEKKKSGFQKRMDDYVRQSQLKAKEAQNKKN